MSVKSTIIWAIVILLVAYGYNAYRERNRDRSPVVTTKTGQVHGIVSVSRGGRKFYEFLGIPYALPPVGELRFEVIIKREAL
jgi:hypothetical protein